MLQPNQDIHPGERFVLLLLDPLINGLCLYLPLLLLLIPLKVLDLISPFVFIKCSLFLYLATYLNKDIANGKSLGKRFLGYAVVNESNQKPPRRALCFLRNLTIFIYPAELIYGFILPEHKISDSFTKTKVIKTAKDPRPISSFYNDMKAIPYNDETREVLGLTVLLFLAALFI